MDDERHMHDWARRVAGVLRKRIADQPQPLAMGTVASYTAGPPRVVTVVIRDPAHPITANWISNSYTPTVNDRVLLAWLDNQLCAIGAGG